MPKSNPLTQSAVNKLECPPGRKSFQQPVDPQVPGLLIEIRHTGSKTYFLRYRDADLATRYHKIARSMDLSLSAVKKEALRLRSGIVLGDYPDSKPEKQQCMTYREFFESKYLPFAKPRKRSWRDDEKLYTSRLKDLYGHVRLDKITRHDIQQFHGDLKESGLAPATCDHYLGLLSRCLRLAVEWQLLDTNPAAGLKKFNQDNARNVFLSPEELQRLLHVLDNDRVRMPCLAVKLMLFTGCRKGEALHARWSDIDRESAVWTVAAENSKSRRTRNIPLGTAALEVLEQLSALRTGEHLFTNSRNGERLKSLDKTWQRLRVEAGLPDLVLHGTRHHFASMLASQGVDLYRIQKILGHASPTQTQRYSHLSGSALQEAANSLNDYLEKALNGNSNN
jgi:integrase